MDKIDKARYTKISVPFYLFLIVLFGSGGYWVPQEAVLSAILGGLSYIGLQSLTFQKELIEEIKNLRDKLAFLESKSI
jgi:asparagine N-glycosylation enzyme membrane subunit Stt3